MGRNIKNSLLLLGSLLTLLVSQTGAAAQIYRFRSGLHLSREHQFTKKERQLLEERLREATGFVDLRFDEKGTLELRNRDFQGASPSARKLIEAVVDSADSFILESTPNSPAIAFAQIEATVDFVDALGKKHQAWNIRLDWADFAKLRGSEKTVESFSPVMILFHELGHGQLKLRDPVDPLDALGECETYVNQIRKELGLPLREAYVPKSRQGFSIEVSSRVEQAEFRFTELVGQAKPKTLLLSFDLDSVCANCRQQKASGEFGETWIARVR